MEFFGLISGILLFVAGLGILGRMPWQFSPGRTILPILQVSGSIVMISIGVLLVWLVVRFE